MSVSLLLPETPARKRTETKLKIQSQSRGNQFCWPFCVGCCFVLATKESGNRVLKEEEEEEGKRSLFEAANELPVCQQSKRVRSSAFAIVC